MVIQNVIVINFKCHLHKIMFFKYYSHSKFNISMNNLNNELKFAIYVDNTMAVIMYVQY